MVSYKFESPLYESISFIIEREIALFEHAYNLNMQILNPDVVWRKPYCKLSVYYTFFIIITVDKYFLIVL